MTRRWPGAHWQDEDYAASRRTTTHAGTIVTRPGSAVAVSLAASVPVGLRLGLGLGPGLPRLSDPSQWVHWQVLQVASESDSDDEDDS